MNQKQFFEEVLRTLERLRIAYMLTGSVGAIIHGEPRLTNVAKCTCDMNPKPRPNHQQYIEALRRMSPEERLRKAFELSDFSRQLFIHGLRKRFPDVSEARFREILIERLNLCHNRSY